MDIRDYANQQEKDKDVSTVAETVNIKQQEELDEERTKK
jgi:hypothetical protein